MKRKKAVLFAILISFVLLTAGMFLLCTGMRFSSYSSAVYTESARELENPYIGWYQMFEYILSDTDSFDPVPVEAQEQGPGLAMLEINLQNYRECPVSSKGLAQLEEILDTWQSTGRQLIVRFLYDWDGNGLEKEPGDISLILTHMTQTAEIINRHTDCVYILQGVFVGSWGEMHSSGYLDEESLLALINRLDAVIDSSIFLAVRTPEYWRVIARSHAPLSASQAFGGSLSTRLGLFNDGMLGSDTDLGTYGSLDALDSAQYYGKLTRRAEIEFQNALCDYVPNGGEVVIDNPFNDFPSAAADLAAMHVSYLNRSYDQAVFSKWSESVYTGDSPFDGMSGYDYISRHLGYRYVLRSSSFRSTASCGKTAWLSLVLENVGFSSCYRSFDVSLILKDTLQPAEYVLPVQTDTRLLSSGEEVQLDIPLDIRSYATGSYDVFLKISDPVSGCEIFLANESDSDRADFFVGSLEIKKFPDLESLAGILIGK